MWYRALVTGEQLATGCVAALRSQFAIAIQSAGEPPGACLFITSREVADVTGPADAVSVSAEDAVYFSPASVASVRQLIARYNAQPSPPPARARAMLLVGALSDWDLLPRSTH
jgi:hypothetical protein